MAELSERDLGRLQQKLEDAIKSNASTKEDLVRLFQRIEEDGKNVVLLGANFENHCKAHEQKTSEIEKRLEELHRETDDNAKRITDEHNRWVDSIGKERQERTEAISKESQARQTLETQIKTTGRTLKIVLGLPALFATVLSIITAILVILEKMGG